jgi:hypothetical protein
VFSGLFTISELDGLVNNFSGNVVPNASMAGTQNRWKATAVLYHFGALWHFVNCRTHLVTSKFVCRFGSWVRSGGATEQSANTSAGRVSEEMAHSGKQDI